MSIIVELKDFENYREKLTNYASSLFRTRGFHSRSGELKSYSEDAVQSAYLRFHKWGTVGRYETEKHLENFLISIVYDEYLQSIDFNRRGAQYLLYKVDIHGEKFKEEFRQLDIKRHIKPTQDEFDAICSFRDTLIPGWQEVLNYLLEGYNQKEIAEKMGVDPSVVNEKVRKIREKYQKWNKD